MNSYYTLAIGVLGLVLLGLIAAMTQSVTRDQPMPGTETEQIPDINEPSMSTTFSLTSSAFKDGELIPARYTCDGDNVSPPLSIRNIPAGTKTLALIADDPDIPESVKKSRGIQVFDHWVLFNIPSDTKEIQEGKSVGTLALNGAGKTGYTGPCPPDREHRYFFKLYALDMSTLNFIKAPTRADVEGAITPHILATTTLIGMYDRPR